MRHFFILGSTPALSVAEILTVLGDGFSVAEVSPAALIVESANGTTFDAKALMARLGGTIKIGTLETSGVEIQAEPTLEWMFTTLRQNAGGATFGISIYGMDAEKTADKAAKAVGAFKHAGMTLKKRIKETGSPARWVEAREGLALTSVAVGKNEMLEKGAEFVILVKGGKMSVGRTLAIQPFEEFSQVDYGRPERDTVQGMLPPKLARMMINAATGNRVAADTVLADPFCGSGTVLTEAMLLGFRTLYGSDKNPAAIEASTKNIAWLREKKLVSEDANVTLFAQDARQLGQKIAAGSLDAIVAELYLGPNRTGRESRGQLQKTLDELTKLYLESLDNWRTLLKPGAVILLAMPIYVMGTERHGITLKGAEKLGYSFQQLCDKSVLSRLGTHATKNGGIFYGRSNQLVWRELVALRLGSAAAPAPSARPATTQPADDGSDFDDAVEI